MAIEMESVKRRMKTVLITVVVCLFSACVSFAQSERSLIRDGNNDYKENKYTDAEVHYRKALEKNKDLHQGAFNLGDALYKQGRFDEAAEQYRLSATKQNDENTKAQSLHNAGNALLKGQKYPESIAAYKEALKLNPNDADTKYNLEYAKAMLKQQQQNKDQKNDKQNKDQQKDQQKKDDKQKQDQQKQQEHQKQEQEKQEQEKQRQAQQKDQQKQGQQKKQQISKEDAERILEALKNEEKDVQKKLHKKVPARIKVEKDW